MNEKSRLLLILLLGACTSCGIEKNAGLNSPPLYEEVLGNSQVQGSVPQLAMILVPISDTQRTSEGFKILLDQKGFQIREICTESNMPYCAFRKRCSHNRVVFRNQSPSFVTIKKILFERLTYEGGVIAAHNIPTPLNGVVVSPWMETNNGETGQCICDQKVDRYCTPEFPESVSPFLVGTRIRLSVWYEEDGRERHASENGIYELIRDMYVP